MSPPKTAQVRIIGNPSHTAATDSRLRRECGGTGSFSYSEAGDSGASAAITSISTVAAAFIVIAAQDLGVMLRTRSAPVTCK
ncbi:Uncharacterised protein [Mycobacteroides abscessus subsp. abscessus]|nr:Uncharacterised protein [Mycobacteroides abscessus subsp. abscessus]